MVNGLDSASIIPGSNLARYCTMFLGKTLYSHSAFLHLGVIKENGEFNAGDNPAWIGIPSGGD